MVLGRPDQLEQVFINIGLNAFDAMPNGGTLTIQMDAVPVIANADHPNTYIVVKLRDTGVGIPPENISHLFEPFYTTKKRGAGSGLGLFVSYLIIDQHGGAIEVESALGQGTTFTIKLPVTDGGD
jgi:signal transduction histidine kinase